MEDKFIGNKIIIINGRGSLLLLSGVAQLYVLDVIDLLGVDDDVGVHGIQVLGFVEVLGGVVILF